MGDAFRQSMVWRAPEAFSRDTHSVLESFIHSRRDWEDTLDSLLTVATLPEHPFNAKFLDERLRRDPMPERDRWWSTYLHRAWGGRDAVDRLVDWASCVSPDSALEDETVDLCATTLAWMLTTSNRFLRDHATKALVSLLTGRLGAVARLVERFGEVDDPYVAERVYAVAYGTAMRSLDAEQVGELAAAVYARAFAGGSPRAHILLRDYARGVVERAVSLGAKIDVDVQRIRPPYVSEWPRIPTEDDIKPLLTASTGAPRGNEDLEWTRGLVEHSVMAGDFADYVIGANSTRGSTYWLSVELTEPRWVPPEKPEDALKNRRDAALAKLETTLGEERNRRSRQIVAAMTSSRKDRDPPRFDLHQIQRYILWRVYDLGWTTERFGEFDATMNGSGYDQAAKPERIGKKYQWIAYHEIMAHVADHFQYRELSSDEDADDKYRGPWQVSFRDIDPSWTLRSRGAATLADGPSATSWHGIRYENWRDPTEARDWVKNASDLPNVETLLRIRNPGDPSEWINLEGHFNWEEKPPADQEPHDVERRELRLYCTGYLVPAQEADAFMEWAEGVDFWGRWMPESPEVYQMYLGEHGWSEAFEHIVNEPRRENVGLRAGRGCPIELRPAAVEYVRGSNGFDCSMDERSTLRLPGSELITGLRLRWSGHGAVYIDAWGRRAAYDPAAHAAGPSALLLREEPLREFLCS
jgi:hypothetical protein